MHTGQHFERPIRELEGETVRQQRPTLHHKLQQHHNWNHLRNELSRLEGAAAHGWKEAPWPSRGDASQSSFTCSNNSRIFTSKKSRVGVHGDEGSILVQQVERSSRFMQGAAVGKRRTSKWTTT
ncbi:hypothetical protein LR48_Vigan03g087400 [Vigna angularis]|uniref:Uncharacterized protein n=2 Tax=Phaseolus angularis TaxID=3914 RepID=A0A0L9U4A3_PHAAN|nr:hypothetical protein LR48_Vigan03g087400 [Vigna angularis]BAT84101.1 hypothetical protein VIGAN_04137600 [Vigna angularis var. angularis]